MKKAVSIKYFNENLKVPVVSAAGEGKLAEKIIDTGIKNGIEIIKNERLADEYCFLKPGDEIPEHLYSTVAEILAYLVSTNKKRVL